ncbi:MAG: DUF5698 domain-containing protein [Phycisphaerales bacterium]
MQLTDTAWNMILGCVMIAIARVGDVSLGTIRTVAVISGHRALAWLFGLMEMTIWVFAVSTVITHIRSESAYGLAFAVGAATGNYVGVTLQRWRPSAGKLSECSPEKGTHCWKASGPRVTLSRGFTGMAETVLSPCSSSRYAARTQRR